MNPRPRPITVEEARRIDRTAQEIYGIPPLLLMENAGRGVAEEALRFRPRLVVAVVAKGNNGADAVTAARHLFTRGVETAIYGVAPLDELEREALLQMRIARALRIPFYHGLPSGDLLGPDSAAQLRRLALPGPDNRPFRFLDAVSRLRRRAVILDGLFGCGLSRPVRGFFRETIERMNRARRFGVRIVAVDVPSGLDADTGRPRGIAVRAHVTVTMQRPKVGFRRGRRYVGKIVVAPLGCPG